MKRRPLLLEQLEERIFLDANPLAVDTLIDDPGGETVSPAPSAAETAAAEPDQQNEDVTVETTVPQPETGEGESADPENNNTLETSSSPEESVTASPPDATTVQSDSESTSTSRIVVVDSRVHDYQQLVEEIQSSTAEESSETEILVIDGQESGVDQLTEILSSRENVQALHILSYGDDGNLTLGTDTINADSLAGYGDELQSWKTALTEDSDILLYGCDIAQTNDGEAFVRQFAEYSGADVAASIDNTGNSTSGGDWDLEYHVGAIETESLFQHEGAAEWDGILDPVPVATVNMPAEGLIEENITFTVSFTNTGPSGDIGYGPYLDVYVPVGLNVQSDPTYGNAGLSFQKFTWDSTNLRWDDGAGTLIDPALDAHPFDSLGGAITVDAGTHDGDQWYVIELPFGSFTPEQPAADITFTAELDEDAVSGVDGVADSDLYAPGDAVVGESLTVTARAGFRFGADSLDNPGTDPVLVQGGNATGSVTPQLATITKTSDAPEGQTVTGPNFPVEYTIVVDIAPDQVVDSLILTDYLPNNAYYRDDYAVVGATVDTGNGVYSVPVAWLANSTASGDNDFVLPFGNVTGNTTDGTPEITLTYSVYFADTDATGAEVIPVGTGDDRLALNESNVTGEYTHPLLGLQTVTAGDTNGDDGNPGALDADGSDYQHEIDSITVVKNVGMAPGGDTGGSGYTPGDTLVYTLDFEISDYFGFENIVVADELGDGQHVLGTDGSDLSSFNPTLTVYENGTTVSHSWDLTTLSGGVGDDFTLTRGADGISYISFNVSALLMRNGDPNGELLGDLFAGDAGTGSNDNTVNRPGAGTRGTITFQTVIDENYINLAVGDISIDAMDPIVNETTISGDVLSTTLDTSDGTSTPDDSDGYLSTGFSEADSSNTEVTIIGINTVKDIPFLNGAVFDPNTDSIKPGDVVTYRLTMNLPTGDLETFSLTDYLPLPVYDVSEFGAAPDFNNAIAVNTAIDPLSIDLTTGGRIYWGTGTDLQYADHIVFSPGEWPPTVSTDTPANSLTIDMGTFNSDSNDGPWVVEILVTVTVQNAPFADGLYLTNQAEWTYNNTFGNGTTTDEIVQVELSAPEVVISKGVIATDSGDGIYTPDPAENLADLTINSPGSGDSLVFTGEVTALELSTSPIDSDLAGVDGADFVTFAVTLANVGGSAAYGLEVRDTMPEGFVIPATAAAQNLQVWDGQGNKLTPGVDYTLGAEGFLDLDGVTGNDGITFVTALDGDRLGVKADGVEGDDVFIITYDLQVDNETLSDADMAEAGSSQTNTASIVYYTGQAADVGDPTANWVDPTDPPSDDAVVTIDVPTVTKELVSTEIIDAGSGTGINELAEAVIGERVTYTVRVTVPEGETVAAVLHDRLDRGLELVSIDSIEVQDQNGNVRNGVLSSSTWGNDFSGFAQLTDASNVNLTYTLVDDGSSSFQLNLGNVLNTDVDDSTSEVIVVSYTAMVVNDSGNVQGVNRNNSASLSYDVPTDSGFDTINTSSSSAANIQIIEPDLRVVKTVVVDGQASGPVGQVDDQIDPDSVNGDAGDSVVYTILIEHRATSGAPAFDVELSDIVPVEVSGLTLVSAIHSSSGDLAGASVFLNGRTIETNSGAGDTPFDLAFGETLIITVSGNLLHAIPGGDIIRNEADIEWTSYSATPAGSDFVTEDDVERTGDSADPGELNNYNDMDPTLIQVLPEATKFIANSEFTGEGDALATGDLLVPDDSDLINQGREVVIGELVTYQVDITLPEALFPAAVLTDTLDPGLTLVRIDSISLTDPHGNVTIANDALRIWDWTTSPLTDLNASADPANPAHYITYTHNPGGSGSDELTIDFGNVTNGDLDNSVTESLTIVYTVMVTDVAGNTGNDMGVTGSELNNEAQNFWEDLLGNPLQGPAYSAEPVEVLEPGLTIDKAVAVTGPGDAGDEIRYTITVEHSGNSESDAYDLLLHDTFDAGIDPASLALVSATVRHSDGSADTDVGGAFALDIISGELTTTGDIDLALSPGNRDTLILVVGGTLTQSVNPGDTIENSATVEWTSLDGNRTDYSDFAGSGEDQERTYTVTDAAPIVTVPAPAITKVLESTDVTDAANGNDEATIGEFILYQITVDLTEGVTNGARVIDSLTAGMEFVDIVSITGTENGSDVISDLAGGIEDETNTNLIGSVTGSSATGQTVTFTLGNLTIDGDNNGTAFDSTAGTQGNDQIIIRYRAVVVDIPANDSLDGTAETFDNGAQFSYTNDSGNQSVTPLVPADSVTLVEPELEVVKTVNNIADPGTLTGVDAGDAVTYEITIQHSALSGSGAYDVILADDLPDTIDFTGVGAIQSVSDNTGPLTTGDFAIVGGVLQFAVGGVTADNSIDMQVGRVITVQLAGTLLDTVQTGETISNTATVDWSSLPAGHDNDNLANERGSGLDADTVYQDSDDALITLSGTPDFDKRLTDESDREATIGETVSYDLIVTVPEGTTNNVVLTDDMPAGMSFLSASLVTLAADSNYLSSNFAGSISGLTTTTSGLNDAAVSIALGNVVASGSAGTADNQFVVRVVALVLDVPGNDGLTDGVGIPDQTVLTNDASMEYDAADGSTVTEATETDLGDDPATSTDVTVVEPELQIVKDVDILGNNFGIAGDTVTYTLIVDHTGQSTSDAHDVTVADLLPPEFVPTGFTAHIGINSVAGNFQLAGQGFTTLTPLTVAQGETLTIVFTGTISNTVTSATFVDNIADLTWSSVTQAAEVDSPYIVDGTDGIDSDREYTDSDDAEFSVPEFEKTLVATSLADTVSGAYDPANADLTIGEIVTYHLTATLPNGALVPTVISDTMPSNLEILSATVLSIGSDISGSSLAAGGSGAVIGSNVSFDFGTVTVADDDQVDEDANRIVVVVQAVVVNDLAENNASDTKSNSGSFAFGGLNALEDTVVVDIVEPDPVLTKTFYDETNSTEVTVVDAGDRVTVRLQITNSGTAPLYDAVVTDSLDVFFDLGTAMVEGVPGNGFVFGQSGADISFTGGTLQAGQTVTLAFSVVVSQAVTPNTAVINTAVLTGDTLPAGHANNNDTDYDRPYSETASDNLLTPDMSIDKAFVVSDNPDTPDAPADGTPDLNVGEIATFHFRVTLPEGTMPSLEFIDQLPSGMQYVDGTARLLLDTAALGETSPLGDVNFAGSVLGGNGIALNNGDFFSVTDVNSLAGDGNDIQIDFGQVIANGQQGAADRQFIIELQAVVLDVSGNQSGTELVNTSTIDVPGDGTDPVVSNPEVVEVVDPVLDISKLFFDASGINEVEMVPGGSTVTVSLSLVNSGSGPSYDLEVQDPLDATKFNVATIAPAITPAGYTVSVSGNVVTYRGAGAIMPGETVTFTYTVQVIDGFRQVDNTATVTAGDTVPGDSFYERDHDGALSIDTLYEFVEPLPSVVPPILPPLPPVNPSVITDPGDVGLQYMAGQGAIEHGEIFPFPDPETNFLSPPVPVSPIYTGRAEPGTTLRIVLSDALGNRIGYQTVMADTAGNWLAGFTGTLFYDMPHRMEITQTASTYNNSTPGLFNLRTHFNPAMVGLISSSVELDVPSINAYQSETVMESLHQSNQELLNLRWDQFSGYEFFVSSTNPSQTKR